MDIASFVAGLLASQRVDYAGAAQLKPAQDFVRAQGGDFVADFSTSVSIGIVLPHAIVDLLPRRSEKAVQVNYRQHAYEVVNRRLDEVASETASSLQRAGYRAFPISASEKMDDERLCSSFSHKLAAHLSGLGWIGKSCLLVTPEHGPRVRWATVLTDAPAGSARPLMPDRCGDCTQCVDACPAHAFTGRHFSPEEPREARYKADRCDAYFSQLQAAGNLKVCGMCLYVCPFGTRSSGVASGAWT